MSIFCFLVLVFAMVCDADQYSVKPQHAQNRISIYARFSGFIDLFSNQCCGYFSTMTEDGRYLFVFNITKCVKVTLQTESVYQYVALRSFYISILYRCSLGGRDDFTLSPVNQRDTSQSWVSVSSCRVIKQDVAGWCLTGSMC